ncbi:hypothetical protein [Roseovarius gaetbuli]|nr:hypothetical protein [Roseovarius gaetbuli]
MPLPRQDYDPERGSERPNRKRRKPRKGLARKMLEEIWDVVEDIFD